MSKTTPLHCIAYGSGLITSVCGFVFWTQWYLGTNPLIHAASSLRATNPLANIFFILIGVGFLCFLEQFIKTAKTLSLLLLFFCGVILLEYLLNTSIDTASLFSIRDYSNRLGLSSAIAFSSLAVSLLLLSSPPSYVKRIFRLLTILISFSLGIIGLISYRYISYTTYEISTLINMSPLTAIGFIILSLGFLAQIYVEKTKAEYLPLLSLLTAIAILILTFVVWQLFQKLQDDYLNQDLRDKATNIVHVISVYIEKQPNTRAVSLHRENLTSLWKELEEELMDDYKIAVYDDQNQLLYISSDFPASIKNIWWNQSINFNELGQSWTIMVWATNTFYAKNELNKTPVAVLIIGLFFALLASFLVHAIQLLRIRTKKLHRAKNSLALAYSRLDGIIEGSDDLIAALDLNLNFIAFNTRYSDEAYRVFNIKIEIGMNLSVLLRLMSEENKAKTMRLWNRAFEGQSFKVIESFKDKNIKDLHFEIHYNPIRSAEGKLIGASHTASNVSQRIQNEQRLAQTNHKLEHLVFSLENQNKELLLLKEMMSLLQTTISFQAMLVPISTYLKMILKPTSGAIYLVDKNNPTSFKQATTWGHPIVQQQKVSQSECWALLRGQMHLVNRSDAEVWCNHVCKHKQKPEAYMCIPLHTEEKNLGFLYVEMSERESSNTRLMYFSQILSEQIALSFYNIQLRDKLTLQSTHDSLTGLYNRRFFEEYVNKKTIETQSPSSSFFILLIDIDHFKHINDNYGHLFGDKVLKKIANQLDKLCQENDILCRWGGEEFIIYMNEANPERALARANNIRHIIQSLRISYNEKPIETVTLSIGVAQYPDDGKELHSVIEKADIALYEAKTTGRNRTIVYQKMAI